MRETRLDRRRFIQTAAGGVLAAVAGCSSPGVDTQPASFSRPTTDSRSDDVDRAEGSVYTDVYESVIDSVTSIRVFGVEGQLGRTGQGQGTGFLSDDAHVVTNEHVVGGGEAVEVRYSSGEWTGAEVLGTDFYSDLAVLEVEDVPESAAPLSVAEKRPVVGQEVLAIGNPFGLEGSMSKGIVSGVNRSLEMPDRRFAFPNVVQTDAAINPGNSGGPLVNVAGDLVGVINAGGGDNIGFAISAALTERVVPSLIETGDYEHAYMGVGLRTVDPAIAAANDLPEADGVIVASVVEGGPAEGVLRASESQRSHYGTAVPVGGDVIRSLSGTPVPDRHALSAFLALEASPEATLAVEVYRDGATQTVDLPLEARPEPGGYRPSPAG